MYPFSNASAVNLSSSSLASLINLLPDGANPLKTNMGKPNKSSPPAAIPPSIAASVTISPLFA